MSKNKRRLTVGGIGIILILLLAYTFLQQARKQNSESSSLDLSGLQLAEKHCVSCHAFPKAEILPQSYWKQVLPIMGFFLGAGKEETIFVDYLNPAARNRLSASGIFPKSPLISKEEWKAIQTYYVQNSPEKLSVPETAPFDMDLKQFKREPLPWKSTSEGLSYLNFNKGQYELGFYTEKESYYVKLDQKGQEAERTKIASPLVDVIEKKEGELLLLMGEFQNLDIPTGKILNKSDSLGELRSHLERPIDIAVADFDQDGIDDFLVAEFGKFLGGINIYTQEEETRKINVHVGSGAVKMIVRDINRDGLQDFYVLITQADESVYLFMNRGDFIFDKKRLLRLPAHYGTTDFELLDVDGDGDEDIICSSGDSGDFGMIPKPFHGVRLFENQGDDQYNQVWFYPQQGAYGTASADYDQDGDIDIASIGYFAAHFEKDKELFIYFENQSSDTEKWLFEPYGLKGNPNDCWIVIHSADVDQDGDIDILLGANSKVLQPERVPSKSKEWQEKGGMVTVLKNTLIK